MHLTQESSTSSQYTITQSCVAHRLTVSSLPGQPDHTPTRVGVPCVPPHSTYLPRSMNTHSLCTQNALHSPASVQITLAGSLPVTQKSTIPLGSETTRAGIAAWRICRYNLDTVPPGHTNKAVEAGVHTNKLSITVKFYFTYMCAQVLALWPYKTMLCKWVVLWSANFCESPLFFVAGLVISLVSRVDQV